MKELLDTYQKLNHTDEKNLKDQLAELKRKIANIEGRIDPSSVVDSVRKSAEV